MNDESLYLVVTDSVVRTDSRLAPLKGRRFYLRRYKANRWGRCVISGQRFEAGADIGYAKVQENGKTFYLEALIDAIADQGRAKPEGRGYVRPKKPTSMSSYRIPDHRISQFQEEATNLFLTCFDNLILESRAGGGKTTMLKHLASFRSDGKSYVYLAFNTKNAVEGRKKMPPGCTSSTTHSFLGKVIDEHLNRGEKVDNKHWLILDDLYPSLDNKKRKVIRRAAAKMTGLAKNFAVRPDDNTRLLEVLAKYDFDLADDEYEQAVELANDILKESLPTSRYGTIWCHDDTLWWPVMLDMHMPHHHVVLLDEIQDFNDCQIWMVGRMLEAGSRVVAVGDPHQALYRFRGADSDAFERLCTLLSDSERGAKRVVLPVNYRSGKAIISYVQENTHVKDIEARPDAPEGEVRLDLTYDAILDMLAQEEHGAAA